MVTKWNSPLPAAPLCFLWVFLSFCTAGGETSPEGVLLLEDSSWLTSWSESGWSAAGLWPTARKIYYNKTTKQYILNFACTSITRGILNTDQMDIVTLQTQVITVKVQAQQTHSEPPAGCVYNFIVGNLRSSIHVHVIANMLYRYIYAWVHCIRNACVRMCVHVCTCIRNARMSHSTYTCCTHSVHFIHARFTFSGFRIWDEVHWLELLGHVSDTTICGWKGGTTEQQREGQNSCGLA